MAAVPEVAREKCTTGGADRKNWTLTVRKPGAACGDRVEMLEMAGVVPCGRFSALDTAKVDTSPVQYGEGVSCVLVFVSPRGFVVSGLACLENVWA